MNELRPSARRTRVALLVIALALSGEPAAQGCAAPVAGGQAYLQVMFWPDLPQASYDLMEIKVTPVEWKTEAELAAMNDPRRKDRFRMLAFYFDMANADGTITPYLSAWGNLKIHNASGWTTGPGDCRITYGRPTTRTYSSTLMHEVADRGAISESTAGAGFAAVYDAGEGANNKWNSLLPPTTASPMYPEGSPVTLRIEKASGLHDGTVVSRDFPACTPASRTGRYSVWQVSADTAHDGRRHVLGEHRVLADRGEIIRYSRGVQFEVFQADCLEYSPVHLVIHSIRVRDTAGKWLEVRSGEIAFWHYGMGAPAPDWGSAAKCAIAPGYDGRFGAYAMRDGLHIVAGHDGDGAHRQCGRVSWGPALRNLSTRGTILAGDRVMIGGFIVGGTSPKKILVTARGPSLAAQGVQGTLANPSLTLHAGSTAIAANDDWATNANAADIAATGFGPTHPSESALLATLDPGAYTAIVTGADGSTGIGIVEAFEVGASEVPLINIATRAPVLEADNVLIGGFILQGDSPRTVLVTARGPSLASQGVPGVLSDPVLTLYSGATPVASNDDWQSNANAAAIQATGVAPANAKESALLMTLNPGAYTAIVTGANNATGIGIVEVFAQ